MNNIDKYPRTPQAPFSPSASADDTLANSSDFIGRPIVVTEKLDGSNVLIHNGNAYPRSTSAQASAPWLAMVKKHTAWRSIATPNLDLFGEDIYGVHSIQYYPVPENRTFYLFAAHRGDQWLSWPQVERHASNIDVTTVPVLFSGQCRDEAHLRTLIADLLAQPSKLGPKREGVVVRIQSAFHDSQFDRSVCKAVRPNHVQPDAEHWSHNWTPCPILPALTRKTEVVS